MAERKFLGQTPPMRETLSTEMEKRSNEALRRELRDQGTFESPLATQTREEVIAALRPIANRFVRMVAEEREPNNATLIRDARGFIFTYGSYRLGVVGPGSDIDTIVVAPNYVTLDDFFKIFPKLLTDMTKPGEIEDLKPVPTAFVPIIKFEFRGISIDLIFSAIKSRKQLPPDPNWSLKDVSILRGMDDTLVSALNGPRVTDAILELVPEQATFKLALRAIKLWAKRRGLYGQIYSYPGGVAWAIAVARVCQLYPRVTASVIVNKFFFVMDSWRWPLPVLLTDPVDENLGLRTWNPTIYGGNRRHIMPIITPVYPSFCTTHNVIKSSLAVTQREFKRGLELTDQMVECKRPWEELFERHTFFTQDYKYYLTVTSISRDKEAHKPWSGYIESRFRHLAADAENNEAIALARPSMDVFDRAHVCKSKADYDAVLGGSLAFVVKEENLAKIKAELEARAQGDGTLSTEAAAAKKEQTKVEPGTEMQRSKTEGVKSATNGAVVDGASGKPAESRFLVYTTTHFIGLQLRERKKDHCASQKGGGTQVDLSGSCNKFMSDCFKSELYEPRVNDLRINYIKNFDLPTDVFKPGEAKPTRRLKQPPPPPPQQKQPQPHQQQQNGKKRSASSDDTNPNAAKKRPTPQQQQQQQQAAAASASASA
ncbi:hypothetical protein P8C59_000375 [Phyllachora maydis]|uniref:Poly(A) polymerase n=1 Tax=Phyllachora maydis TaxID=1825666 RepID=A0AAD9M8Q9_9PEZI|nr:hypothetical protein P8C59_000375 [Phyllachora maydis]